MNTSVRFRPRRDERETHSHLAESLQTRLDAALQRLRSAFPQYVMHLAVVLLALAPFYPLSFELPFKSDLLAYAISVPGPALEERQDSTLAHGGTGPHKVLAKAVAPDVPTVLGVRRAVAPTSASTSSLLQAPVVHTTIPERPRRGVTTYRVQGGDTVLDIATKFGLQPETVAWANGDLERDPDLLRSGQELTILPIDGVYHTVVKGESLEHIAQKYGVRADDIANCEYNDLPRDGRLAPGTKLIVPGGVKPYIPRQVTAYNGPIPPDAKRGTGVFVWPASGRITDRFGFKTYSGRWHTGLDIAANTGTPIYAADAGFVTFTGTSRRGYGKMLIVDHGNGYVTYYAHLSVIYVSMGQSVDQGALIGAMGSTGNSTGPHLHFEIRHRGVPKDPELDLP
jgi:murein DD-endopeptidase MepM/ murein hydrolase activator NlpD